MTASFIFALMVGAVSSVNPCGFALLPAYFVRRLSLDTGSGKRTSSLALALTSGTVTTAGVVLAFGLIGAAVSFGMVGLANALPWVGAIIGVILVVIGGYVLTGHQLGLTLPISHTISQGAGMKGDFGFGLGFGLASLSCTLPIFLSVTALSTTGNVVESIISFVAFGLGMGTVITAIAVTAVFSRDKLANIFKNFFPYANKFGGMILLLAGAYITYYWSSLLFSSNPTEISSLVIVGEQISSALRKWVGSDIALYIIVGLLGLFLISTIWVLSKNEKSK